MYNSKVLLILLASLPLLAIATVPAHAYGREQWQTTFSFNCNASISFCSGFGFWGWCAFGGSAPDGLSGSTGDCQITLYNFNGKLGEPAYGPTHLTVDYSHWFITTGSMGFPTRPDLVSFWGTGTVSAVGPGTSVLFPGVSFRSRLDAPQEPYSSSATRGSQRCLDTIPGAIFHSFHSSHHNRDSNTTYK